MVVRSWARVTVPLLVLREESARLTLPVIVALPLVVTVALSAVMAASIVELVPVVVRELSLAIVRVPPLRSTLEAVTVAAVVSSPKFRFPVPAELMSPATATSPVTLLVPLAVRFFSTLRVPAVAARVELVRLTSPVTVVALFVVMVLSAALTVASTVKAFAVLSLVPKVRELPEATSRVPPFRSMLLVVKVLFSALLPTWREEAVSPLLVMEPSIVTSPATLDVPLVVRSWLKVRVPVLASRDESARATVPFTVVTPLVLMALSVAARLASTVRA